MAKKFDLSEYIDQTESKLDTMPQLTAVPLELIDPSPSNFYSMPGLEELADNIATVGLLEPPRVRENNGRYTVVSGHRRRAPLRILVERGEMDPHEKIPVFLDGEPDTGAATDKDAARIALRQLRLIYANSDNRQYTGADKAREVQELTAIFEQLRRLGYEFPGRLREHVAAAAKISESRAARLTVIGKKLTTPQLRAAFDDGRLGETAAYEIARRSADVIGRVENLPIGMICGLTIERLSAVLDGLEKQVAEDAALVRTFNSGVSFDADNYLQERAEEDSEFREGLLTALDFFFKPLVGVCTRRDGIGILKETLGRCNSSTWRDGPCIDCSLSGVRMWGTGFELTRTWTEVYDVLCTIALNGAKISGAVEMTVTEPQWQSGEPTEDGWHCCWATWEPSTKIWQPDREPLYWRGGWFETPRDADNCVPAQYEVHKWCKIPEDPEEAE